MEEQELEAFCSVLVWNEELPFRPSGFVVMNGEESLWGEEGAPYKPNTFIRDFSPWQTPVKSHYRATGFVLVSPSLQGGMRGARDLTPLLQGPRQRT